MTEILPTWGQVLPSIALGAITVWKMRNTDKKIEKSAKDLDLNTSSPEDVMQVEKKVIALQAELTKVKNDLEAYRGQAVNLAQKYTEATNVLSKEFSAQRFALTKALEPGPNVDVTVLDEPQTPIGKVIVKP